MSRRSASSAVSATMLAIYEGHGTVTPELVVVAAEPEESPIHAEFDWNDSTAGPKYRLVQAGELIRSCKTTITTTAGTEREIRQFVSVRAPSEPSNYEPITAVENPLTRRLILSQMQREIDALVRRYSYLEEFWDALGGLEKAV